MRAAGDGSTDTTSCQKKFVLGVLFNDGIEVIAKPTDRQPANALRGQWQPDPATYGERAIGVLYRPEAELASHYFRASLPQQFFGV